MDDERASNGQGFPLQPRPCPCSCPSPCSRPQPTPFPQKKSILGTCARKGRRGEGKEGMRQGLETSERVSRVRRGVCSCWPKGKAESSKEKRVLKDRRTSDVTATERLETKGLDC